MIYVKRGGNVVSAYIKEGFRRMYSASIDSNGQYVDFDEIVANSPVDSAGRKLIPFDDIFCFWHIQKKIREDILKTTTKKDISFREETERFHNLSSLRVWSCRQ